MLYSSLTSNELGRWIAVTPRDLPAKAEMLRRACTISGGHDEYIDELQTRTDIAEEQAEKLREEVSALEDEFDRDGGAVSSLQQQLQEFIDV